jgi:branched-chain amino acid transport system ATP-binding protein
MRGSGHPSGLRHTKSLFAGINEYHNQLGRFRASGKYVSGTGPGATRYRVFFASGWTQFANWTPSGMLVQTQLHATAHFRDEHLLSVREVCVRFGGIVALDGISFDVTPGQIVGIIGPNGAGKTTLFNCLSRLYVPNSGDILFEGLSILRLPRHAISKIGIGRTFQNVALFDDMSVLDNVKIGCHSRTSAGFLSNALRLPASGSEERLMTERAQELIAFMDLKTFARELAGGLPFPVRKRVELARALAGSPKLLLLDEPAAGLNHDEVNVLRGQIRRVRDAQHVTILLVEHHMNLVMSVSDKVVALDFGRRIAEGSPSEVQRNSEVIRAYLGTVA